MTEFPKNLKKTYFWSILPISGKIQIFTKTWAASLFSPYGSLTSCTVSRKNNEWIPRKVYYEWTNRQSNRQKDWNSYDPVARQGSKSDIL